MDDEYFDDAYDDTPEDPFAEEEKLDTFNRAYDEELKRYLREAGMTSEPDAAIQKITANHKESDEKDLRHSGYPGIPFEHEDLTSLEGVDAWVRKKFKMGDRPRHHYCYIARLLLNWTKSEADGDPDERNEGAHYMHYEDFQEVFHAAFDHLMGLTNRLAPINGKHHFFISYRAFVSMLEQHKVLLCFENDEYNVSKERMERIYPFYYYSYLPYINRVNFDIDSREMDEYVKKSAIN